MLNHPHAITDTALSAATNKTLPNQVSGMDYKDTPPTSSSSATRTPPSLPSSSSSSSGGNHPKARALFAFNAQDDSELSFKVNDIITILEQSGECKHFSFPCFLNLNIFFLFNN